MTDETTAILKHFGYVFEQRGLVSVKGKGQLMTYYLIGKGGSAHSNGEVISNTEETKSSPNPSGGLNEDNINILTSNEDSGKDSGYHNNISDHNSALSQEMSNLNSTTNNNDHTNHSHQLELSDHPKHQPSSEDTSPLIIGSTTVISGSSETHLLEKSDIDDWNLWTVMDLKLLLRAAF